MWELGQNVADVYAQPRLIRKTLKLWKRNPVVQGLKRAITNEQPGTG